MSNHFVRTRAPFKKRLFLITCLLLMGLFNPSFAQQEDSGGNATVSVVFSEVSETQIVGQSPDLGIELSAVRENDNDVVSIQLGNSKTLTLSRNVGTLNFYVSSNQLETTTSVVIQNEEGLAIDSLAQYLWQYRGYSVLGDTLLDALLVLSNWPQGVAFEEPELSTDDPDRLVTYQLSVTINTDGLDGSLEGGNITDSPVIPVINCGYVGFISLPSMACSRQVNANQSVTLTATPAPGYSFKAWSGACTGTATTCTINMSSAKTVTAKFTKIPQYTLTVTVSPSASGKVTSSVGGINCGNGGTACSAILGENVTLTATPAVGYSFKAWSGACTGIATTCTVSVTATMPVIATSVIATFITKTDPLIVTIPVNSVLVE